MKNYKLFIIWVLPTLLFTGLVTKNDVIAKRDIGLANRNSRLILSTIPTGPNFKLPYSYMSHVYWTGGPHELGSKGLLDTFSTGMGSGIDFAGTDDPDKNVKNQLKAMYGTINDYDPKNFRVLAMSAGKILKTNEICPDGTSKTYGCWIAVKVSGFQAVLIYAHLRPGTIRFHENDTVKVGDVLALAGDSGLQDAVHLHVDLHDSSNFICNKPKSYPDMAYPIPVTSTSCYWGTPLGWDTNYVWLDDYMIWGYSKDTNLNTMMNYDGSAVRDTRHIGAAMRLENFLYTDVNIQRKVVAWVSSDFPDITTYPSPPCYIDKTTGKTSCENNLRMDTQFATVQGTYGWPCPVGSCPPGNSMPQADSAGKSDAVLISSNVPLIPSISSSGGGGSSEPANGVELCSGIDYGGPCALYTWNSNDACINLADSGMDNSVDSIRFHGDYSTYDYEVVMYEDNSCNVYNARYGTDASTMDLLNNQISSIRIEKHVPALPPGGGRIELYDITDFNGDTRSYTWSSNDQCIDLNYTGMSDRAESLRFFDWYIGNFDVIFYGDNNCQVYNARYGEDASTFDNLNNQFSSIRIEQHGTLNPNGWIRLFDGTNFGGEYRDYRYQNNDKCIDLNSTGMSDRSESIKFFDYYVGNFDVILYGDNVCQVYNARYGEDSTDFIGLNNQFSSMRIEKHQYLVPDGTLELCDGEYFGGTCISYRYTSDGHCFDLNQTGMNDISKSVRFRNGYVGEFDAIFYGDNACQVYNARFGEDASSFGNLNNQFSSMRLEHHGPIMPDLIPYAGTWQGEPVTVSSQVGSTTKGDLVSGGPIYINWGYKNAGIYDSGSHNIDLYIDNLLVIHASSSSLASDTWNGAQDVLITTEINSGWHQVRLLIDQENLVSEANETNNTWASWLYWEQPPVPTEQRYKTFIPSTLKD